MRLLSIGSLPLPEIYVVRDSSEAKICRAKHLPYIIWDEDYELLVKLVLLPSLMKLFPDIRWPEVLDIKDRIDDAPFIMDGERSEASEEHHQSYAGGAPDDGANQPAAQIDDRSFGECDPDAGKCKLEDAIGDLSAYVDIEMLSRLGLLPKWLDTVKDAVRKDLDSYDWESGYNKKLGMCCGTFEPASNGRNLLIIDVSHSIPAGIAATMLSLADTLRGMMNADLIITGATSGWYPMEDDLPTAVELRLLHGRSNEGIMFNKILHDHVLGRDWENVVAFGDNDHPDHFLSDHDMHKIFGKDKECITRDPMIVRNDKKLAAIYRRCGTTRIGKVYSFHTWNQSDMIVGYARWCLDVCHDVKVEHVRDWAWTMR